MKQNRPEQGIVCCPPVAFAVERDPLEMLLAGESLDFDPGEEIDFRIDFDPLDQILRHALAEIVTPNGDRDAAVVLGQIDRGLSRRNFPLRRL